MEAWTTHKDASKRLICKENCVSKHLVEVSEKRALSRAVLKICNLYEHGVFGEDEDVHRNG